MKLVDYERGGLWTRDGRRLIVVACVALFVGYGMVALRIALDAHLAIQEADAFDARWKNMAEAFYPAYAERLAKDRLQALEKEFRGWESSRLLWHKELERLERARPPEVSIYRVLVRSEIKILEERDPKTSHIVPKPYRLAHLQVNASIPGGQAQDVVGRFVSALSTSAGLSENLPDIKLQGVQTIKTARDMPSLRMLGLEAHTLPRAM